MSMSSTTPTQPKEEFIQRERSTAVAGSGRNLLEVTALKMHFPLTQGIIFQRQVGAVRAVDGIDFFVEKGETLGLVGESGCGKSTTGRAILQLYKPTSGSVKFDGTELTSLPGEQMRKMRRRMQMIFQDPYASLNPRMTVGNIIGEPIEVHNLAKGKAKTERVQELLKIVGLNPYFTNRYPHEFSGGQRQRIGVARQTSSWRTSRSPRSTCPSRRRSSTCSKSSRTSSSSRTCSSRTTSPSCVTSATASP
jgi:ABC-type glutathione transport system ATPase component